MAIELRPPWCLTDDDVREAIDLTGWCNPDGSAAFENDGDSWAPGTALTFHRVLTTAISPNELRRRFGLAAGIGVAVAARWTCRKTAAAGTHLSGPEPVDLGMETRLDLSVPPHVADRLELETSLLAVWNTSQHGPESPPDGAVIWSDTWSTPPRDRTVLLEGSETRIPVQTIDFATRFDRSSEALWAIDVEPELEPDDLLANSLTVLLNEPVLVRDFSDPDGTPDASLLPAFVESAVQVQLVTELMSALRETLEEMVDAGSEDELHQHPDGTVGAMLSNVLTASFGAVPDAFDRFRADPGGFTRVLWSTLAPGSWKGRR